MGHLISTGLTLVLKKVYPPKPFRLKITEYSTTEHAKRGAHQKPFLGGLKCHQLWCALPTHMLFTPPESMDSNNSRDLSRSGRLFSCCCCCCCCHVLANCWERLLNRDYLTATIAPPKRITPAYSANLTNMDLITLLRLGLRDGGMELVQTCGCRVIAGSALDAWLSATLTISLIFLNNCNSKILVGERHPLWMNKLVL